MNKKGQRPEIPKGIPRGYKHVITSIDGPNTPSRTPNHTEVSIGNEITEFMEQRPNVIHMYQTDPHIHNLLTQAIINKTTVDDLLEGMLIVSCEMREHNSTNR